MAHRDTFPTGQYDRLASVSVGVDPQKERRASAPNWFVEIIVRGAQPPDTVGQGRCQRAGRLRECKMKKEIKVNFPLELVLWTTDFE